MTRVCTASRLHVARPRRSGIVVVLATAMALVALASCSSGSGSSTDTTAAASSDPKAEASTVLCNTDVREDGAPTDGGLRRMVDDLVREANLPQADDYEDYHVVCDNTGVTTLEAPVAFTDVEPTPYGPPATSIRVSPDFLGRVEAAPITGFFVGAIGGSQFPTQPSLTTVIRQSADGSLSSGTRDPREGKSITEDCQPLPVRNFTTGTYSGKARFYVNCGAGQRAWVLLAAEPETDEPYFFQIVAQVLDTADAEALGRALNTITIDAEALARVSVQIEPPAADTGATTTTAAGGPATTTAP